MKKSKRLIIGEEIFNSITHGLGFLLGIIGLVILLVLTYSERNFEKILSSVVFGGTLILAYLFSTLFHSLSFTKAKKVFMVLDHNSIFLLIAGTYTPFTLLALRPTINWIFLLLVWLLALTGIAFRSVKPHNYKKVFVLIYLLMGWLALIMTRLFPATFPSIGLKLLLIGGLCYTAGTLFYLWRKLPFNHGIWHLFAMTGSFCHFLAVFYLVI